MVTVYLESNNSGEITGFIVEGHAEFDEAGKDIVCAAVSVLTQTTALSLQKLLELESETLEVSKGRLTCRVSELDLKRRNQEIQLLLRSMELGLQETAHRYPDYLLLKYL